MKRSRRREGDRPPWALLLMLAVPAVGGGLYLGMHWGSSKSAEADMEADKPRALELVAAPEPLAAGGSAPPAEPPKSSSLGMVRPEPGLRFDSESAPSAKAPVASSLKEAARRGGAKVSGFTARFKRRHPIMYSYSREWMSHPDLKRLNDDYMRDRDQVAFVHGLMKAPSFGPMVRKFAMDRSFQALLVEFATGLAKETPADLMASVSEVLKQDSAIRGMAAHLVSELGLPPALTAGIAGGKAVDQKAVMEQILQAHPELRRAAQGGN